MNKIDVTVTTGDLKTNYEIIGPVFFQVSNKGMFGSALGTLVKKYKAQIDDQKNQVLFQENELTGVFFGENGL